jgi:hypothetical protein
MKEARLIPWMPIALAGFVFLASCGGGTDSPPAAGSPTLADFAGTWVSDDSNTKVVAAPDGTSTIYLSGVPRKCALSVDTSGTGHFARPREMAYEYDSAADTLTVDFYDDATFDFVRTSGESGTIVGEWAFEEEEDSVYHLTIRADGTCASLDPHDEAMPGSYDGESLTFAEEFASATVDTSASPNTMAFTDQGDPMRILTKQDT